MAHRAGTADAPIPGLVTSRRNPAYRLKPKPREHAGASTQPSAQKVREALRAGQAVAQRRKRSASRSSIDQSPDTERRERERKELEVQQERKDAEAQRRKREEEEAQRQRWAEQEARWAQERRLREEQRRVEEERQAQRQKKLKGAFAVDEEDGEANDEQRAKELAEHQRRRAAAAAKAALALLPPPGEPGVLSIAAPSRPAASTSITSASPEDAVKLRASLADPAQPRSHAPGEVAEHFRRLSEMKRRFRRAEFGGPDRHREPSRSRSRDPDKYNSVWIRSGRA